MELWRSLETILSITHLQARTGYIVRCCRNVCFNRYRKIKKYEKMKVTIDFSDDGDDEGFFENNFFKTEETPEDIITDFQIKNILRQFATAKLLIRILKI